MTSVSKVACSAFLGVLLTTTAYAKNEGKLPKDATPMSSEDAKAFYTDKTISWDKGSLYRSPDGKAVGISKTGKWYGEGTWSVSGNEACYDVVWHSQKKSDDPYNDRSCEKLYKAGNAVWLENTAGEEKYVGDIWTGVEKKLKKGDQVSKRVDAIKAKNGM